MKHNFVLVVLAIVLVLVAACSGDPQDPRAYKVVEPQSAAQQPQVQPTAYVPFVQPLVELPSWVDANGGVNCAIPGTGAEDNNFVLGERFGDSEHFALNLNFTFQNGESFLLTYYDAGWNITHQTQLVIADNKCRIEDRARG